MRLWGIVLISLFLAGCTGAVNDFVQGGGGTSPNDPQPSLDLEGTSGFKLSPGSVISSSSVVNMRATITPTQQNMTSSAANAQMSLSASQSR